MAWAIRPHLPRVHLPPVLQSYREQTFFQGQGFSNRMRMNSYRWIGPGPALIGFYNSTLEAFRRAG